MTAQPAPLFSPSTVLTSATLNSAQRFHIDAGRRHRAAAHLPGAFFGLTVDTGKPDLYLQPGYAVDAFGRDLVLDRPLQLASLLAAERARWPQADTFQVLLHYQQIEIKKAGSTTRRLDETPRVEVRVYDEPSPPLMVDIIAPAPDDPAVVAPVRVGVLQELPDQRDSWVFRTVGADRQEAGLVAAQVVPGRNETASRLELSQESFSVVLPSQATETKAAASRLVVNRDGATIGGALTVNGSVDVTNAVTLKTGEKAIPPSDGPGFFLIGGDQSAPDLHELRLVLPEQGALVIGAWNAQAGKFEALLTVDSKTRSVTIDGDLIIEGAVVRAAGSEAMTPSAPPQAGNAAGGAADGNSKESAMQTVMDTIKGWLSTTTGSSVRLILLLTLALGMLNWDRALTVVFNCEQAKAIRLTLHMTPPVCKGGILFSASCAGGKITESDIDNLGDVVKGNGNANLKEVFNAPGSPDISVYCPKK